MSFRLQKVDELSLRDHYHLVEGDDCWYYGEYTAYQDWSFSAMNQLIKNYKKKMEVKGSAQWQYKEMAIRQVGSLIANSIDPHMLQGSIIVPIPPSRSVTDPNYDPRLVESLAYASTLLKVELPVVNCLFQNQSTNPDHESQDTRLYPQDRANSYTLHADLIPDGINHVVFFDDMLTTGSHFKGAEICFKRHLPNVLTSGLFISRRVHVNDNDSFSPIDLSSILKI